VPTDMDKGDLDREEAKNTLAGPEQVGLFAGTGNSLLGIAKLGDNAKVVAAKGNPARREGESLADRPDGEEHCMHPLELGSVGIGDAKATRAVEGAIASMVTRGATILQEPGSGTQI